MSSATAQRGGATIAGLRRSVRRDSFSDFLPLVAWEPETEAFLCIDDSWGHAWEVIPTAYMFAHVQGALQGLLNVHFPDGTVLQLHTFADPLIDDALDLFLDLKTRDDPLIQASARRTREYLSEGRHGLAALHNIPVRNFRTFLSIKTRRPLGEDLRRQVEEQLAKLGIRRLAPEEVVAFYRRIFNGAADPAPGVFADAAPADHVRPSRRPAGRRVLLCERHADPRPVDGHGQAAQPLSAAAGVMNGLLSGAPSPIAARLTVAATTLLLVQLGFVLMAPMVTGGLRATSWIVGAVAGTAFGFALFGRWPVETRIWSGRHDD